MSRRRKARNKEKNVEIKTEKNKSHKVLKFFLSLIFIGIIIIGGFIGYSVYKNGWGVKAIIQTAMGQDEKKLENLEPFTVLIMGVSEDISSKLTDTIIVASYNPKNQKATLLSIPRDTFVGKNKAKATSYDKINAIAQHGKELKPEKTLDAVNKITGLNITYYLVVSNNALVQLVDEIGGVEFDVPIDMDYDDSSQDLHIHLKKGYQKLNGEQAEWLVRFRKNNNGTSYPSSYGDNDIGRMRTQREFLKTIAKKMIQIKNITKIKSFIDIFKENVQTNITNWQYLKEYIPYMIDFNTENIQAESLPGTPATIGTYNLSFFVHNEKETKKLVEELFAEQNKIENENIEEANSTDINTTTSANNNTSTIESSESKYKIELLNGSGDNTILTKITNKLKEKGYNVYKTGTTTNTSKTTIINKTAVPNETTTNIKEILGVGSISSSTSTSSTVDITIIIGKDCQ